MVNSVKSAKFIFFLFLFYLSLSLHSETPVKVAFLHFASQDVPKALGRTVNEVILSFTSEFKGYAVQDFGETLEKIAVMSPDIAYVFTGKITGVEGGLRLELLFKNKKLEMVRYIAKDYEGTNKVLLESRLLVRELFNTSDSIEIAKASYNAKHAERPKKDEQMDELKALVDKEFDNTYSIDSLAGAWYGEDGEVEKIMIMRGGRGVAIWVSGISLLLDLKLEDGILIVSQKGGCQPRQFVNLPDSIANMAAKSAKPIVWQFSVDQNLKVLSGLKRMSAVQYKNDQIVSISEVAVPVTWHRN